MDIKKYMEHAAREKLDLLTEQAKHPGKLDPDVVNLKLMLLDIQPYSRAWRSGYVRSLRRAIEALEAQNRKD